MRTVLALDGVYPFDLGIPARVFGEAEGRYEVLTCSVDGHPVATSADFEISVRHDRDVIRTADTIVAPRIRSPSRDAYLGACPR